MLMWSVEIPFLFIYYIYYNSITMVSIGEKELKKRFNILFHLLFMIISRLWSMAFSFFLLLGWVGFMSLSSSTQLTFSCNCGAACDLPGNLNAFFFLFPVSSTS